MPILDLLTSTRRPDKGTPVLPREQVIARLQALNRETAPYCLRDGKAEGVDIVAEWKIVDARWGDVFAKAGLTKVFRILLRLDEAKHEVRALDREYSVSWSTGVPSLELATSTFRGQTQSVEFGKAYAFTEKGQSGEVYNYRFDTREIKKPIQDIVTGCGWTYKGVTLGKL